MTCEKNKLPSILPVSSFSSDRNAYTKALYRLFKKDFIDNDLFFKGKKVEIIHEKLYEEKERSFWHIISEGDEDINRTPISYRAEKIRWARPIIEDDGKCSKYRYWVKYNDRTKRDRHYIWCTAVNYLVILEDRGTHYKLITAFPVIDYKVKSYQKDYKKYGKTT